MRKYYTFIIVLYYIAECIKLKRQVVQAQMHTDIILFIYFYIILTATKQFYDYINMCSTKG